MKVELSGGRGEHLAHPVRSEREVRSVGIVGHPLAAPARQIRNHDLFIEVQLGFVDDPPSAWTAAASVEGSAEFDGEP